MFSKFQKDQSLKTLKICELLRFFMILYDSSKLTYFKSGERRVEKECEEVCIKEEKSEEKV